MLEYIQYSYERWGTFKSRLGGGAKGSNNSVSGGWLYGCRWRTNVHTRPPVGSDYHLGGDKSHDESHRRHFPDIVMKTSSKYLGIVGIVSYVRIEWYRERIRGIGWSLAFLAFRASRKGSAKYPGWYGRLSVVCPWRLKRRTVLLGSNDGSYSARHDSLGQKPRMVEDSRG